MFVSIGADIEVFAKDKDGHHRSVAGLIGGTKETPLQVLNYPNGFALQEDNVSLEFNIPPTARKTDFTTSISYMRTKIIPKALAAHSFKMAKESSVSFVDSELTHPNALVFGCEPDYDAWRKIENKKPKAEDKNLRTAGGHIHVGSSLSFIDGVCNMDLLLGVPSVILDDTEASRKRRELYGKAGAMRPKPYGWEYRVLSNYWMFSDELVNWVYNQTKLAASYKLGFTKAAGKLIQSTINTGDKDAATTIIKDFGITLPS